MRAVNGACGAAHGGTYLNPPSTNLCSSGTATSVTTNPTTYTWTCNGSGGGTNAPCTANRSSGGGCWGFQNYPGGGPSTNPGSSMFCNTAGNYPAALPIECEDSGSCTTLGATRLSKCSVWVDNGGGGCEIGGPGSAFTLVCRDPGANAPGTENGCALQIGLCRSNGQSSTQVTCPGGAFVDVLHDDPSCCTGRSICAAGASAGPAVCGSN